MGASYFVPMTSVLSEFSANFQRAAATHPFNRFSSTPLVHAQAAVHPVEFDILGGGLTHEGLKPHAGQRVVLRKYSDRHYSAAHADHLGAHRCRGKQVFVMQATED